MHTLDEQTILRFLLGELSADHREQVEERLFRDDGFYEQVLAIQEELADDYVQDKLSPGQRAEFEKHFLRSPRRRKRVEFAAALSQAVARPELKIAAVPAGVVPWWRSLAELVRPRLAMAASAAALVLMIGASWSLVENRRLSGRIEQTRRQRDSLLEQSRVNEAEAARRTNEMEAEIAALRTRGSESEAKIRDKQRELEALRRTARTPPVEPSTGILASFILSPGLTRGTDEPEKLIIPLAARLVQLQLDLEREENYQTYVVEIRTARGNLVWSKSELTMHRTTYGWAVTLNIPVNSLPNSEYELTLKGAAKGKLEAVGYYYFIGLKK